MSEEFYHKDLFGSVVDIDMTPVDEDLESIGPKGRPDFNIWQLTDALGTRDKKSAWVLYQKALAADLSAEEIFFKLVWQVKTMLLASRTKSAIEADMKDFPYSKAKSFLKNFKVNELEQLSENFVTGYHEARQGKGEIETLIEKILLSL